MKEVAGELSGLACKRLKTRNNLHFARQATWERGAGTQQEGSAYVSGIGCKKNKQ